jgi:hypothetical protein
MNFRSVLFSSVFGLGVALAAGQASAVVVTGSSSGTFSGLSHCHNSGSSQDCRIVSTSNHPNYQVQWGSDKSSQNFYHASTLTAVDVSIDKSISAGATVEDVRIAQLTWFNSATNSNLTPDHLNFNWNLTVSFTSPNDSSGFQSFSLSITNPTNPTGDTIKGFNLADLSGLTFNLNGVIVSDLKYVVADGSGSCSGTDTYLTGNKWYNCEDNTAYLYITADFTATQQQAVPEPATLAMFGAGLLGLGVVRRRKFA